jgi:beta-lactamase class A
MKRSFSLFFALVLVGIGLCLGFFGRPYIASEVTDRGGNEEMRLGIGHFTNPLLECNAADGILTSPKQDFKPALDAYVAKLKNESPTISKIAVSFRDLNGGPSFGSNRDETFFPASLLKVPVMMAIFKHAESDRSILEKQVVFTPAVAAQEYTQDIPVDDHLLEGQTYSVAELLRRMIIYSDNDALQLLSKEIPPQEYLELFQRLGVDARVIMDPTRTLSARQYATFFMILFNASYLTQEDSEAALSLLAQTVFDQGLRGGVPNSVPIAHKFGERELKTGEKQLHDCGIVYYPKHPYLLCVMTRGPEFKLLERTVADVSAFVYGQIDQEYGAQ